MQEKSQVFPKILPSVFLDAVRIKTHDCPHSSFLALLRGAKKLPVKIPKNLEKNTSLCCGVSCITTKTKAIFFNSYFNLNQHLLNSSNYDTTTIA